MEQLCHGPLALRQEIGSGSCGGPCWLQGPKRWALERGFGAFLRDGALAWGVSGNEENLKSPDLLLFSSR